MQDTIYDTPAIGTVGEYFSDALKSQETYTLGTDATIGVAMTFDATNPALVNVGGTGVFAGILNMPKDYVIYNNLNPTLNIPKGIAAHVCRSGYLFVKFSTVATKGQAVFFDNTTGVLGTGTATTGQTQILGASVHTGGQVGDVCVIEIIPQKAVPA